MPTASPGAVAAEPDDVDSHPVTSNQVLAVLLTRVATGDHVAFRAVYTQTTDRVTRVCRQVLIDAAEAEDAAQDVYLEVWTKARAFDPGVGSAVGWVLAIAHHRAVDRVRNSEVRRRRGESYGRLTDEACEEPGHRLLESYDAAEVRAAISRLSRVRREALTYAFFTDHTHQQASALLGIPLGTYKSRVRDAVHAVRVHLTVAA